MLENFGLRVLAEHPYQVTTPERVVWIQDFELEARDLKRADIAALEPLFKEAFLAAWRGDIENDGFNRLLLCAGLSARDIVVVRAYCRYLLQTGIPFSQAYMERVLVAQAPITAALVRLFQTQFALANKARESAAERITKGIRRALDKVASLDEDRILRSYLTVIRATLRTNYYQTADGGRRTERPRAGFRSSSIRTPSPTCRCPARSTKSSCTARASKACTCAWETWPAAAFAGRTGAKTSAPKCSDS